LLVLCWYRRGSLPQSGIRIVGLDEDTDIMLTDKAVRNLKPKSTPYKVSDSGGLHVLVQPSGSKLWRMAYRFEAKQRTLAFGVYPATSLIEARDRRDDAKRKLRQGEDPGKIVKAEKLAVIAATANTFSAIGEEWKQRKLVKEKKSRSTLARTDWLLHKLNNGIGDRPINEVTAPELLKILRKVEAEGLHETVARLRSVASRIFRYGIATGKCERDVATDLRGATTSAVSTPHAAVIDPTDIGALMRKIDTLDGGRHPKLMRLALRLLAYVFVRPGELRLAEWSEIEGAVWNIPGPRMKMRLPHRAPLSRQAVALLDEVRTITGAGKYVFTSTVKPKQPLHKNSFNDALRRLGYGHDQMTSHGFRALASTTLNEMNRWPVDVIERQLAHQEHNKVRRVYNRATHWPERVAMMQAWADHLDSLRDRGRVVALRA
jgi:integrase